MEHVFRLLVAQRFQLAFGGRIVGMLQQGVFCLCNRQGPIDGLQPAAAVQNNGVTNCFYLMGGFQPADASHPGFANTDGLVFNPQTKQWSRVAEIIPHGTKTPMTLIGMSGGRSHLVA